MLRLSNDGRILLSFKPPGFFTTTKYELMKLREIEAQENEDNEPENEEESSDDDSEEDNTPVKTTNIFEALENA